MRALIDAHMLGSHETGNETYILNLVRGLAQIDEVECAAAVVGDGASDVVLDRVRAIALKPPNDWARLAFGLASACRAWRAEVLHVTYVGPVHSPCPLVVSVHDPSFRRFPTFFSPKDRLLFATLVPMTLRRATAVITLSKFARTEILDCFPYLEDRVFVTPLAPDARFHPKDRATSQEHVRLRFGIDRRFVLAVGNLQPRKNLLRLIRAFGSMHARAQDACLVIVGKPLWDAHSVYDLVHELGLLDHVSFTGYVSFDELMELYNAASVFAYPTLYEGFGLPVLEAMTCGTPVVSSRTSSIPEVAGGAALLVDPLDEEEMAHSLLRVLDDPALSADLSVAGFRQAAGFSWRQTASSTVAIYDRILSGR